MEKMNDPSVLPQSPPPDCEVDRKALTEFYWNEFLTADNDEEGLGPDGIEKLADLVRVLKTSMGKTN